MTNLTTLQALHDAHTSPTQRQELLEDLRFTRDLKVKSWTASQPWVSCDGEVDTLQRNNLKDFLFKTLSPWKKGPYRIFDIEVDAEWRSDIKWQRILDSSGVSFKNKTLLDIGCNNGYMMFRSIAQDPALVVGIEPTHCHYRAYHLLNQLFTDPRLHFYKCGIEHLYSQNLRWDLILCLGILYHHTDPVTMLRHLRDSLNPKGEMILDVQGVAGEESTAFFPARKYTGSSGFWWLPTRTCLLNMLKRVNFSEVDCFYAGKLTAEEQRRTAWADYPSLTDHLNPQNPDKTIEGYPAPLRFYVRVRK